MCDYIGFDRWGFSVKSSAGSSGIGFESYGQMARPR